MSPNMSPKQNGRRFGTRKLLILKVGTARFELTASCTPSSGAPPYYASVQKRKCLRDEDWYNGYDELVNRILIHER